MRSLGIVCLWIAGCLASALLIQKFLLHTSKKTLENLRSKGSVNETWTTDKHKDLNFEWKQEPNGSYSVRVNNEETNHATSVEVQNYLDKLANPTNG